MEKMRDDGEDNMADNSCGNEEIPKLRDAVRNSLKELGIEHSLQVVGKRDRSTEP